jgi:putative ABC transport system substrate-binding protein
MPDYEHGSGTNIAFTSLDMSADLHMIYIKKLKRNLQSIAIMYARNNWSAVTTQAVPLKELAESEGINVLEVVVEDQKNARVELEEKVPLSVEEIKKTDPEMQNSIFWITGSTSVFREIETINKYSEKIPVLSVVPDVVQEGDASAVLSVGVGFENNALKAALYVVDILQGKVLPRDLKVGVITPPDIAINFKKAKAIGLTIPFSFFESATSIYDYDGDIVRFKGRNITQSKVQ